MNGVAKNVIAVPGSTPSNFVRAAVGCSFMSIHFLYVRFGEVWISMNRRSWIVYGTKYWGVEGNHHCDGPCLCLIIGPWDNGILYKSPVNARPWDLEGTDKKYAIWNETPDEFLTRLGLIEAITRKMSEYDIFHQFVTCTITSQYSTKRVIQITFIVPIVTSHVKLLK
jgi:hypothetical protein